MAYKANKYSEYFVVDEGYYPEINESSIKDPKNKWQHTFPHGDIVALLGKVERALSRSDKKSLWLEGTYGTGKSRIIWMLQNLLTCSEEEFDGYFNTYDNLRDEIDLRERLRTIRSGKVVTAFRYATGDITSTQKLIFVVFESLTAALRAQGCKFDGAKTLRGKIASWLESDAANLEMFRAKIHKPEYRMSGSLANRSAEEIIERLKNPGAEVAQLVEDILKLGEREGIRAFNIDMSDLIDWISEIIAENNLKGLIFFWDEFSKFFTKNRNNLDEFQRLAELSNIEPFYLFIATHESDNLASVGDQAFRTVKDRFTHMEIKMPDNIALELVGHALQVKEAVQEDWKNISAALRERTTVPRLAVMNFANIRDEKILTDILPIHPITAILLKHLANYFASNQRSIFNFIKNSDPGVKAFQEFISTKSPYDGDLLTIDYLWNFFYESSISEQGGNVGRITLKPQIRSILDSYAINKEDLTGDEQAILKTILLLQAINQESGGQVEFFRPTEKNLELAFTGVAEMENGRAVTLANNLVRKNILYKRQGKIEMFELRAILRDEIEIEKLKDETIAKVRTADLIEKAGLMTVFSLTAAQKFRCELHVVTVDNFTLMMNRLTNEQPSFKLNVAVFFARNDAEQNKMYNLIGGALHNERFHRLIFVDASSNSPSEDIFNRWVENTATEQYCRRNGSGAADQYKNDANDCLREWRDYFMQGSFVYYPATKNGGDERRGVSCQNIGQITDELKDNVRKLFPSSFDDAGITDTLFLATNLRRMPEVGIKQNEFSMLKSDQIKIILGDVWRMGGKYWEVYPDLTISRLKVELDRLIKDTIEQLVRISFDEIFSFLLERGFLPLNIYAFLTGFLLKEYAADPYRYSAGEDGNQGGAMNAQKLTECIYESIRQTVTPAKNYRPKYLEILSQNQRQFMKFAAEVFKVSEDISVEQSAQKLRLKLKHLDCPLWCYVEAAADEHKDFLQLLAGITNSKDNISVSASAELAGQFLTDNPGLIQELKIFFTTQKGYKIFMDFLENFEGGTIFSLAREIGIENPVKDCKARMMSGDGVWLHDKETAANDLGKLIVDYLIVLESRNFNINGRSFGTCARNWAEYCNYRLKLPADTFGEYYPPLREFFAVLKDTAEHNDIPQSKRDFFLDQLRNNAEAIQIAMSEPLTFLREKYAYNVGNLTEDELDELYTALPYHSFTLSRNQYHNTLMDSLQKVKSVQHRTEMMRLWLKVSGSKSPRDWSREHRTPIMAMIALKEQGHAKKIFETIMSAKPTDNDVVEAISYLRKHAAMFKTLNNQQRIEENFRLAFLSETGVLFDDNDEIRDELEKNFSGDVYQWYGDSRVNEIIEKFAEEKYYKGGACEKLTATVERMSGDDVKKLLLDLLQKNYEVGLKLLREA